MIPTDWKPCVKCEEMRTNECPIEIQQLPEDDTICEICRCQNEKGIICCKREGKQDAEYCPEL